MGAKKSKQNTHTSLDKLVLIALIYAKIKYFSIRIKNLIRGKTL